MTTAIASAQSQKCLVPVEVIMDIARLQVLVEGLRHG